MSTHGNKALRRVKHIIATLIVTSNSSDNREDGAPDHDHVADANRDNKEVVPPNITASGQKQQQPPQPQPQSPTTEYEPAASSMKALRLRYRARHCYPCWESEYYTMSARSFVVSKASTDGVYMYLESDHYRLPWTFEQFERRFSHHKDNWRTTQSPTRVREWVDERVKELHQLEQNQGASLEAQHKFVTKRSQFNIPVFKQIVLG